MKKTIPVVMILIFLFPFMSVNTSAEILIQIEKNDTWIYAITDSSTKTISFEAVNFDYFGDEDTLIRVNEIVANDTIVSSRINSLASLDGFVNCTYTDIFGSAKLNIIVEDIFSDELWKTARGNILYQRETIANSTLSFSDIYFNNTYYDNYQANTILTFFETKSNPTILEPLSTGTVKLNDRVITFTGTIENTDYLGLGFEIGAVEVTYEIIETERYEASNLFTYMNTTCRNLTIRPLDAYVSKAYFSTEILENIDFSAGNIDLDTILGTTENWIYSFEAGLPLLITETSEIGVVPKGSNVNSVETVKTMELVDLSLVNSDFTFPVEPQETDPDDTSWIFLPVLSGFLFTFVISRNLKRKEQ